MSQERYWNYRDDDLTFRLDQWRLGIIDAGLYRGFDPVLDSTLTLVLSHQISGYEKTNKDGSLTDRLGIYVTKQGVVVNEDSDISVTIAETTSNSRIDLIVAEHDYIDVEGGTEAVYKVIQGGIDGLVPVLVNPNIQIIIAQVTLPPNTNSLLQPGVQVSRTASPEYGGSQGRYVERDGGILESNLNANGNKIVNVLDPTNGKDVANKDYVTSRETAILASIKRATTEIVGITELATGAETAQKSRGDVSVTPLGLNSLEASTTSKGLIELATLSEALTGISSILGITPESLLHVLTSGDYVRDSNYVSTDQNFSNALLLKLNSIATGAEVNVRSNWNQTNTTQDDYIQNKPSIADNLSLSGTTLRLRRGTTVVDSENLASLVSGLTASLDFFSGGSFDRKSGSTYIHTAGNSGYYRINNPGGSDLLMCFATTPTGHNSSNKLFFPLSFSVTPVVMLQSISQNNYHENFVVQKTDTTGFFMTNARYEGSFNNNNILQYMAIGLKS